MGVIIQPATLERVESFWRALDTVARERRYLLFTEAPPFERTLEFVTEVIGKGWSQFHALDGEEVVGWCDILPGERDGLGHCGHVGMGVLPAYRRMGIGRRLIDATIADAFAKGIERIELECFASNKSAVALYRKVGFVEEGRKSRARFIDGEYDDFVVMALFEDSWRAPTGEAR